MVSDITSYLTGTSKEISAIAIINWLAIPIKNNKQVQIFFCMLDILLLNLSLFMLLLLSSTAFHSICINQLCWSFFCTNDFLCIHGFCAVFNSEKGFAIR
jgi:hypothetical protein